MMSKSIRTRVSVGLRSFATELLRSSPGVAVPLAKGQRARTRSSGRLAALAALSVSTLFALAPGLAHATGSVFTSGPTLSPTSGTVNAGGTISASVGYSVQSTLAGETVVKVELLEVNGATPISRGIQTYAARTSGKDIGDGLINDPHTASIAFSYPAGQHVLYLESTLYNGMVTDSGQVTMTVSTNAPPAVSITGPANNSTFQIAPGQTTVSVPLTGTAAESFPSVDHTNILVDGSTYQTLTGASATSINLPVSISAGTHSITVQAINTNGQGATTAVSVFANRPPVVALSAPVSGSVLAWGGSGIPISVTGTASDPDGDAVTTVLLVNGAAQATLTGAAATSINTSYTAGAAGTYQFQLSTTDSHGAVTLSNASTIVVDVPPSISMTAPTSGALFQMSTSASYSVPVTGTGADSDGSVSSIQLFVDGTQVNSWSGSSVSAQYSTTPGAHTFQLRATDNSGITTAGATVSVFANQPPAVSMVTPTASVVPWAGSPLGISVTGTASDPDSGDSVSKTELLVNSSSVQTFTGAAATSINATYSATAVGQFQIQLRSTDSHGGVMTTPAVTVAVDSPPAVSMTAPTPGATFQTPGSAPYSMTVSGSATDSDGTVANVQLFVDGASVATSAGASISTTYSLAAGTHSAQLRATDNQGLVTSTAAASVLVNRAPTVTQTAPTAGVLLWHGSAIAIPVTGSVSDPDSGDSISKTEVLVNGIAQPALTGTAATTVSTSYLATSAGTYVIQLRATDSHGGVSLTSSASVDVDAPPGVTLTAPANGASFLTDPNGTVAITVTGTGSDTDGSVANIKLLVDGVVYTSSTTSTISTSYPAAVGPHTFQLQATDNQGNTTSSAVSTVTVTGSVALMSLPQVNTAKAGTIQGQADVSAGKATYETSILMPPGVNGMVPSVSLSYGGGTDIGMLGVGWTMSAGSKIERCPPTIVEDGRVDTVRMANTDRLCIDGKRLQLATALTGCTVAPGVPAPPCFNQAYWAPGSEYRTEIESFVRVTQSGLGYKVFTKEGHIHFYGDVADSTDTDTGALATQVFSAQRTSGTSSPNVHTWALRQTVDRFGNAIDYTYIKDTVSGEFYPRYIRYGANANAGQSHFAKVQFDYAPRNDANVYYIAGGRADRTMRLSDITTFTDTNTDGSGGSQALQYLLAYDYSPSSGRSRLTSLTLCGASTADCLPPTAFNYGNPDPGVTPGFTVNKGTWTGPVLEDATTNVASCQTVQPLVFGGCNYAVSDMFISGDFNGDGVNDLITKYPRLDGTQPISIYINNGTGFNAPVPIAFNGVTVDSTYYVVQTGDFDGDGQSDILLAHTSATATGMLAGQKAPALIDWKICYSRMHQGNGFQCQAWTLPGSDSAHPARLSRVYDFDGDGKDDIYFSGALAILGSTGYNVQAVGTQQLCMSTGTGFVCNPVTQMMDLGSGRDTDGMLNEPAPVQTSPTDFDGDGREDLVGFTLPYKQCSKEAGGCSTNFAYVDTGAAVRSYTAEGGVNAVQVFSFPTQAQNPPWAGMMAVGDLNGDGYSDVIAWYRLASGTPVYYQQCQGMGNSSAASCAALTFPDTTMLPQLVGDYDGDGLNRVFGSATDGYGTRTCVVRGSAASQSATCGAAWTFSSTVAVGGSDFSTNIEENHVGSFDFTGNGIQDIVVYTPGGHWQISSPVSEAKVNEALDRLVQVTDGLGKRTMFQYALPGDSNVYTADALNSSGAVIPVVYPERRVPRMGALVKAIVVDNGQGGTVEHDYHYAGASRDMQGRGYLGFAEVDVTEPIATNPGASLKTTQWFSKTWPNIAAMTSSRSTYALPGGATRTIASTTNVLSSQLLTLLNTGAQTNQAAWQSNGLDTVCPYVSSSTVSKWDIDAQNSLFATTTTTVDTLDAWCNATASTVTTAGDQLPYTTVTGSKFNNDLTNWFIGQPLSTAVTKTHAGGCVVRRSSATFDSLTGAVTSQIVEPHGDPNQPASTCTSTDADSLYTLTTAFNRTNTDGSANKLGLVRLTTQSWLNPVSQTTATRTPQQVTAFEAKGRFAQTVQNAAGQSQTVLHDDRNGSPTQHTDANGLVTTSTTDAFGQETVTLDPEGNEHRHFVRQCDSSCPSGATSIVVDDTLHLNSPGSYTRLGPPALTYRDDGGRTLRAATWGFDGREITADQRYDARGRHVQTDHPHFQSDVAVMANKLDYDDLGRVTVSTVFGEAGDSRPTTTNYAGRSTTIANPANQTKSETKDTLGLLALATDAAGNSTVYGRDPFGNLNAVTDPKSNVVTIVYDRLGRRISLQDPDLGLVKEKVDPAGRTYWTQSPKQRAAGTSTTRSFDVLDRMTHRLEPDLEGYWVFDTAAHGVGELAEAYTWIAGTSTKNYDRVHTYDTLSRPWTTVTTLDAAYTSTDTYDGYGRPLTTTHQRGTTTRSFTNGYNAMGFHAQLTNEAGTSLWQETAQDAWGHEKTALEGALALTRTYDAHTTHLTNATWAIAASNQERYSETSNQYDVLNNLKQRNGRWNYNDPNGAVVQRSYQDAFTYDTMNRLQTATAWSQPQETFGYDAIGNLTSKTSVANGGAYTYPSGANAVGPHAVQSIATLGSYTYDADGNLQSAPNAVSATWTSFDMPLVLTKGANSDSFVYGPEHQRVKQVRSSGTTLYYAGAIEVESSSAGVTMKTYWPGGLGVNIDAPAGAKMLWTPTDKLGNVRAYIDATGAVVEMLDYDAWGKRRNPSGIGTPDSLDGQTDNKGFTGHEMLDNVDLVHMNGRVYDPFIGRFLTADPYVQSPEDSQSYNRYTYVWNNPTNLTDPTGFQSVDSNECAKGMCSTGTSIPHHGDKLEITTLPNGAKLVTKVSAGGGKTEIGTAPAPGGAADAPVGNSREDSGSGNKGTKSATPEHAVWGLANAMFQPDYWKTCAGGEVTCEAARAYENLPGYQHEPGLGTVEPVSWVYGGIGIGKAGILGVGELFEAPAKIAARVIEEGFARGHASEARVLADIGLTKNTLAVSTAEGRSIPDALTKSLSVEVKDAASVYLTKQLRIQTEAARSAGRESVLVTGEKTCVSGPCSRAFDTIIRRSDLGPK